jgi:hypothetical protein
MSDFSNKQAFLKQLEQLLPDDAHYFEFKLKYNSREPNRVMPGFTPQGFVVQSVGQDFAGGVRGEREMNRWTVEGQL